MKILILGALALSALAWADCKPSGDIQKDLACLPGVTSREVPLSEDPKIPTGYRRFELTLEQPVNHFDGAHGTFRQRLALLHRDSVEPMVLHTSGYQIFAVALSELARAFGANQLQVEHRFFDQSIPARIPWNKLDILQSAYDFHRITQTFRQIFPARWVNTGASKGGMTSSFHRRFFPADLDGTVADVAPLSFSQADPRYVDFVDQAGGDRYRDCRAKLTALQLTLLRRRTEVLPLVSGSFVLLGGKGVAYEHAVIEMPFVFWQYHDPEEPKAGCGHIPGDSATAADLDAFLTAINAVKDYGDASVLSFIPYYFQAASQLGSPAAALRHLSPLRVYPYNIQQYAPPLAKYSYSNRAMRDVSDWVRHQSQRMIFVYGEFDPWSAAAFPLREGSGDVHRFIVPGGNHSSKIFKLPSAERDRALAIVAAWIGKAPQLRSIPSGETSLDEIEFEIRRGGHL